MPAQRFFLFTFKTRNALPLSINIKTLSMDSLTTKFLYLNNLSPQFALPRTSSLLYAGAALYMGFVDPIVRGSYDAMKSQLQNWSVVSSVSSTMCHGFAAVCGLLGLNAYRLSRQPLWMYGGLAILATIPISLFAWAKTTANLEQQYSLSSQYPSSPIKSQGVLEKMNTWVNRHRVSFLLAAASAVLYYIAENKTEVARPVVRVLVQDRL